MGIQKLKIRLSWGLKCYFRHDTKAEDSINGKGRLEIPHNALLGFELDEAKVFPLPDKGVVFEAVCQLLAQVSSTKIENRHMNYPLRGLKVVL